MKQIIGVLLSFLFTVPLSGQVNNPKFKRKIDWLLRETVPFISVTELKDKTDDYLLLDAREQEEFDVSRIRNAQHLGFDHPDFSILKEVDKSQAIVVYCSIGYRSEKIGEQLKSRGFTNVLNLYGSIFEWSNRGYPLCDAEGNETKKVHTYNKRWAKWVDNPEVIKVN